MDNGSGLPSVLHPKTDEYLSNTTFTEKDIEKVIHNLDSSKTRGSGMISLRMLKICSKSMIKPLQII